MPIRRLGLIADTHNAFPRARAGVAELCRGGAEALFHMGDLTDPQLVAICTESGLPTWMVFGNNDLDERAIESEARARGVTHLGNGGCVEIGGKRVALTHGHDAREWKRLLALEPDYLFKGHSHRREDRMEQGVRVINPGPLYRAAEWSVALLDLETAKLEYRFLRE